MTENLHRHNWIATFDLQTLDLVSIGKKVKHKYTKEDTFSSVQNKSYGKNE